MGGRHPFRTGSPPSGGGEPQHVLSLPRPNSFLYGSRHVAQPATDAWRSKLGPQKYTPLPGLGLEKIGRWLVWTIWWCANCCKIPQLVYTPPRGRCAHRSLGALCCHSALRLSFVALFICCWSCHCGSWPSAAFFLNQSSCWKPVLSFGTALVVCRCTRHLLLVLSL